MQFTARLLNNSSVRVKISCWCPPCYCWNAEQCFHCFVVKFIVYVYACRGLGPKAVNKNIYLYWSYNRGLERGNLRAICPQNLSWPDVKMYVFLVISQTENCITASRVLVISLLPNMRMKILLPQWNFLLPLINVCTPTNPLNHGRKSVTLTLNFNIVHANRLLSPAIARG